MQFRTIIIIISMQILTAFTEKKIAFRAVGWTSTNVTATMNGTQVPSCLNPVTERKRIGFNFAYSFYKITKYKIKTGKKVISE